MADGLIVFRFEELGDDLARAPLAAQRLFRWTGTQISARGWDSLRHDQRRALVLEGSKDVISVPAAQALFTQLPMREVSMVSPFPDFEARPTPELQKALGAPLSPEQWGAFPGVARFALNALSRNARLLWRAVEEIRAMARGRVEVGRSPFRGLVASCELALDTALPSYQPIMRLLMANKMFDGKGFVLARAAGLRAARRAHETLDMQSETHCGPVELDWTVLGARGCVLWQAHASTWGGEFYPAASMLAVTTAATALYDMMYEVQTSASVRAAHVAEDAWRVGGHHGEDEDDEATGFFNASTMSVRGR